MPVFNLTLSDECVDILEIAGQRIGLPNELAIEEYLATVIETLANSVDTQMTIETSSDGTPLQLQDAVNAILSPDISTAYTAPTDVSEDIQKQPMLFEDIVKELIAEYGQSYVDNLSEVEKQAFVIVYEQLPFDEWNSTTSEQMVKQTVALLNKEK